MAGRRSYQNFEHLEREHCPEPGCTRTFNRADDAKRHYRETHLMEDRMQCEFCGVDLLKRSIYRHLRTNQSCPGYTIIRAYAAGHILVVPDAENQPPSDGK